MNTRNKNPCFLIPLYLSASCVGGSDIGSQGTQSPGQAPTPNSAIMSAASGNLDYEIRVLDADKVLIFSDSGTETVGSLFLTESKDYKIEIKAKNIFAQEAAFRVSVDAGATNPIPGSGTSAITGLSVGSHSLRIEAAHPLLGKAERNYNFDVQCLDSRGLGIDPSKVSVTGTANWFSYYASAAVLGGSGAVQHAWDFNGDGIRDTNWLDPGQTSGFSNHVGPRKVELYVRDKVCATIVSREIQADLEFQIPPDPILYVYAGVSSQDTEDKRLTFEHFSKNEARSKPVESKLSLPGRDSQNKTGKAIFTCSATWNYGQDHVPHGIGFNFGNITYTGSTQTQMIFDSSAATAAVGFATDYASDRNGQKTFQGTPKECTGEITLKPELVAGNPCDPAKPEGTRYMEWVVRGTGKFSCSSIKEARSESAIQIFNGEFRCEDKIVDNCSGGGGGGGGGVFPISL